MKILIVDSEPEYSERVIRFLKKEHEVKIAGGTKQLQNYYEAEAYDHLNYFDIVITENVMPGGIFPPEETEGCTHTAWAIYHKFLKDLPHTKLVIWTRSIPFIQYPTDLHPDRKWPDDVILWHKDASNDNNLLDCVNKIMDKK